MRSAMSDALTKYVCIFVKFLLVCVILDYRENNNMPESPEAKTPAPPTSNMPPVTPAARSSHSASSTPGKY